MGKFLGPRPSRSARPRDALRYERDAFGFPGIPSDFPPGKCRRARFLPARDIGIQFSFTRRYRRVQRAVIRRFRRGRRDAKFALILRRFANITVDLSLRSAIRIKSYG